MILDYKGISVFYTSTGSGHPIVLLHGFLENHTMWSKLEQELSKTNRVICIDLLGHGNTGCLGYCHTMDMMAETVYAVLKHLKIERSIFIGHSMGGYVSLAFVDKYPQQVLGICLANSTAQADNVERKLNRDRAIEAVKLNYKLFVNMAVSNLFAKNNQDRFKSEIEKVKQEALKTPLQGIVAALEGMKIRPDRTSVMKNRSFSKLMIIGAEDPIIMHDTLIKEANESETNYVVIPGGHMSYIENEIIFLQEIIHFIEFFNF
jgi:pimeloyl-ACP methyl ester carboxylesterase